MLEIIKFIFSSFWMFLGAFMLLGLVIHGICIFAKALCPQCRKCDAEERTAKISKEYSADECFRFEEMLNHYELKKIVGLVKIKCHICGKHNPPMAKTFPDDEWYCYPRCKGN